MRRKHHELHAWQEGIRLVKAVYELTSRFPGSERYALSDQLRRAAVSIPSNIAEGAGREGDKEFLRFLVMARGSLAEVETQLIIGRELGYIGDTDWQGIEQKTDSLFGMIGGLINSIKKRNPL